jgi:hypothetical protein
MMVQSRNKLGRQTVRDATAFYLDHLERIQRCNMTVEELTKEVLEANGRLALGAFAGLRDAEIKRLD